MYHVGAKRGEGGGDADYSAGVEQDWLLSHSRASQVTAASFDRADRYCTNGAGECAGGPAPGVPPRLPIVPMCIRG